MVQFGFCKDHTVFVTNISIALNVHLFRQAADGGDQPDKCLGWYETSSSWNSRPIGRFILQFYFYFMLKNIA